MKKLANLKRITKKQQKNVSGGAYPTINCDSPNFKNHPVCKGRDSDDSDNGNS